MSKTQVTWFFLLFNILTYAAYGSTSTAETGDFRNSKRQKEPKLMYGMTTESSQPGIQRTFPGLHVAQQTRISRFAKGIYRGPSNIRPHIVRSANSYSVKPSSLYMAALKHLAFVLLLVPVPVPCLF